MHRATASILVLLITALTVADDEQKSASGSIKFHRKAAGERGEDGWYAARSTQGNFWVALPGPFNDFTQTGTSREGGRMVTHVIATVTAKGTNYVAAVMMSTDKKPLPASQLGATAAAAAKDGSLKSKREVLLDGHKGLELYIQEAQTAAKLRAFDVGGKRFTLVAEFPSTSDARVLEEVDRFLGSLKLSK